MLASFCRRRPSAGTKNSRRIAGRLRLNPYRALQTRSIHTVQNFEPRPRFNTHHLKTFEPLNVLTGISFSAAARKLPKCHRFLWRNAVGKIAAGKQADRLAERHVEDHHHQRLNQRMPLSKRLHGFDILPAASRMSTLPDSVGSTDEFDRTTRPTGNGRGDRAQRETFTVMQSARAAKNAVRRPFVRDAQ
jgi:hypothetical protein